MTDLPPVSTSAEDYLETIFRLIGEKGIARVRDIAAALSVHKSTVSAALKGLSEKGLVNYSPYEVTTLTSQGQEIAQNVSGRHAVIGRFLSEVLAVDAEEAERNACRMEHVLDAEVMDRLALLVSFAQEGLAKGDDWVQRFQHHCKSKLHGRGKTGAQKTAAHAAGQKPKPEETTRNMTTLDRLKPGKKAAIAKIGSEGAVRRRMAEMGLVRGTAVEVIKVAPLGDPIEVKVKGYNLSLRKDEAAAISIELP